jgi:hypothetical protein
MRWPFISAIVLFGVIGAYALSILVNAADVTHQSIGAV